MDVLQSADPAAKALIDDGVIGEVRPYRPTSGFPGLSRPRTGCATRRRAAARCSISASTRCRSRSCCSGSPGHRRESSALRRGLDLQTGALLSWESGALASVYCSIIGGTSVAASSPAPRAVSTSRTASSSGTVRAAPRRPRAGDFRADPSPAPATASSTRPSRSCAPCGRRDRVPARPARRHTRRDADDRHDPRASASATPARPADERGLADAHRAGEGRGRHRSRFRHRARGRPRTAPRGLVGGARGTPYRAPGGDGGARTRGPYVGRG